MAPETAARTAGRRGMTREPLFSGVGRGDLSGR